MEEAFDIEVLLSVANFELMYTIVKKSLEEGS